MTNLMKIVLKDKTGLMKNIDDAAAIISDLMLYNINDNNRDCLELALKEMGSYYQAIFDENSKSDKNNLIVNSKINAIIAIKNIIDQFADSM